MKNAFHFILIILCLNASSLLAQFGNEYDMLSKTADSLYKTKAFLKSAETYGKAFAANNDKGVLGHRYYAACSWAMAGQKDSAFYHLFRLALKGGYSNLNHMNTDTDLTILQGEARWKELYDLVKKNKDAEEINLEKPLVLILDTIYQEDQKYRQQIGEIKKKYGWDSPQIKDHWKIINEKDSINLIKIVKILDERGWLGSDVIGKQGSSCLFLVIQHSDLKVQEKYLPMMRDAVVKKKASASSLALLEDRVALRQGKKQIYGSQVGRISGSDEYYVSPLEDPDNVDKRRAEVGLGTLQSYINNWNIKWDVEAYKKRLPEFEALQIKN
jgi:hypothetical protein